MIKDGILYSQVSTMKIVDKKIILSTNLTQFLSYKMKGYVYGTKIF